MIRLFTLLVLLGFAAFVVRDHFRRMPQDAPWTPLDLTAPIGWATADKLATLRNDPAKCRALLAAAGVRATPVPDRAAAPGCAVTGAVRVDTLGLPLDPGGLVMSCPLAAATLVWAREVVIPAARAAGVGATALTNFGSYNCRRIAGSTRLSEHAAANAVDIAGLRLQRGPPLGVVRDWADPGPRGRLLRDLHAGACRVFGTVLGPDYNRAHYDHFHLDMGGWRACR